MLKMRFSEFASNSLEFEAQGWDDIQANLMQICWNLNLGGAMPEFNPYKRKFAVKC